MIINLIKRPIIPILITMAAAVGVVSLLAWSALKPVNQKNGFNRTIVSHIHPTLLNVMDKTDDAFDLAGHTDHSFYFRGKTPSRLLITDHDLKKDQLLSLEVSDNERIASLFYTYVDSPKITVFAGRVPAVITGQQSDHFKIQKFPASIFSRAVIIGPDSYVFRGFDTTVKSPDQILLKGNPVTGTIQREVNISEKHRDAGITTDGSLHYDKTTNRLVYVFYYSNRFYCLDTNLNLSYRGHTIDTLSSFQTEAGVTDKTIITNLAPKRFINPVSSVSDGYLFNHSMLKADNDNDDQFDKVSAIDIYDLKDGRYKGSFYLPDYKGEKLRKFRVIGDRMIVFYKKYVASYQLQLDEIEKH